MAKLEVTSIIGFRMEGKVMHRYEQMKRVIAIKEMAKRAKAIEEQSGIFGEVLKY